MLRILSLFIILSFLLVPGLVAAQENAPLTIQAGEELKPAINVLYAAAFDGAEPIYVDENADLLITTSPDALSAATELLPDYFLSDAGMVVLTDNTEASTFVDFAVSPDRQQVLIDNRFLPASITIMDQAGNTIEIPQPVRKVITPHSIATYTVYGVGGADRLVAGAFLGARDEPGISRMTLIDLRFPDLSGYTMTQKEIYLRLFDKPGKADHQVADAALDRIGILDLRDRPYTQLSGGQRQMVMIARGLAQQCDILLMDEPDAHLDPRNQHVVMNIVRGLVRDKLTFVISSHTPNHALAYTDRVLLMNNGQLLAMGIPSEILTEPLLSEAYAMDTEIIYQNAVPRAILPRRSSSL